jgi:hypothetical protein
MAWVLQGGYDELSFYEGFVDFFKGVLVVGASGPEYDALATIALKKFVVPQYPKYAAVEYLSLVFSVCFGIVRFPSTVVRQVRGLNPARDSVAGGLSARERIARRVPLRP